MPVCRLFLLGLCVAPSCRYTHVHLGTATPLCDAFARCGWCAAGAGCERRHERFCESYSQVGLGLPTLTRTRTRTLTRTLTITLTLTPNQAAAAMQRLSNAREQEAEYAPETGLVRFV